jgi:transcription antitermination factor NusG
MGCDGKAWYVVEALEGKDCDVRLRLAAAGFEVWRPVERVRFKRRKKGESGEQAFRNVARFGRYIFLHVLMTDYVFGAVRYLPGVRDFVHLAGSDAPARVPDAVIHMLREPPPAAVKAPDFLKKDLVRFVGGPFEGLCGVVVEIDSRGNPVVEMSICGAPTAFPVDAAYVEMIERPKPLLIGSRKSRRQNRLAGAVG